MPVTSCVAEVTLPLPVTDPLTAAAGNACSYTSFRRGAGEGKPVSARSLAFIGLWSAAMV